MRLRILGEAIDARNILNSPALVLRLFYNSPFIPLFLRHKDAGSSTREGSYRSPNLARDYSREVGFMPDWGTRFFYFPFSIFHASSAASVFLKGILRKW